MGLFGPSKNEVWQQLSSEVQGDYMDGAFGKVEKYKFM